VLTPRHVIVVFTLALISACAVVPGDRGRETIELPHVSNFSDNSPGAGVPDGWRVWTLSKFKKPTEYRLVDDSGRIVVKASARASASGLVHPVKLDSAKYPLLSWRWKVDELIATADNTRKHTEDSPVRILVSFGGDADTLPLSERMFFDNIRLATGQQLPYATLVYIWENRAPRNTVIPNPNTSRIKMIVAESGRDKLGAWQEITRNVVEDFRRAFGEAPGEITAVAIMTDTDNTGENAHAYYGDILFQRISRPRARRATD
jgi:hypothetical protein